MHQDLQKTFVIMIMTMKVMVVLMKNYVHDQYCGIEDCLFIRWLYEDNGGGAGMMVITMISISYYHSSYCMAILVPRSWRVSFWLQQLAYQRALVQKEMYNRIPLTSWGNMCLSTWSPNWSMTILHVNTHWILWKRVEGSAIAPG